MDVWLDEMKLLPGQEWDIEIEKAVEQADVVLVSLPINRWIKEGYVQKELRFCSKTLLKKRPEATILLFHCGWMIVPFSADTNCNM